MGSGRVPHHRKRSTCSIFLLCIVYHYFCFILGCFKSTCVLGITGIPKGCTNKKIQRRFAHWAHSASFRASSELEAADDKDVCGEISVDCSSIGGDDVTDSEVIEVFWDDDEGGEGEEDNQSGEDIGEIRGEGEAGGDEFRVEQGDEGGKRFLTKKLIFMKRVR